MDESENKVMFQVLQVRSDYVIDIFDTREKAEQAVRWYVAQDAQDGMTDNSYAIIEISDDLADNPYFFNQKEEKK